MMTSIRQLTQKGDPKLNVLLPKQMLISIKAAAKTGKRSHQDEIIKRLASTINLDATYQSLKNVVIEQIK